MKDYKPLVKDFLHLVIRGKIDEAYKRYVDMKGKQHNLFFPAGFSSLKQAMKENHAQSPQKKFSIQHILQDGELVITHSHLAFKPSEPGMIVMHLFRFKDDKIVEFWDCGQTIPTDMPNSDGPF